MEVPIKEVKRFYDEVTFRKLHGFIYQNKRIEYAWNTLNSILNYIEPKRVLEIGCGIGEISWRLASKLPTAQVVGFDISEKSIELASKLFTLPNLSFIRDDNIANVEFNDADKFDIIFLMDVYEHIPVVTRDTLHRFIEQNISENGFLFLSCPTPQHLQYLKNNIPSEIQPVDENIGLADLIVMSKDTLLKLVLYKEVSVWHAGDYFHAIFTNDFDMKLFSDFEFAIKTVPVGLKKEILRRMKKIIVKNKNNKSYEVMRKKALIKERLGAKLLERIESAV